MSFYLEEECPVSFHFDYAKLAEDVVAFCIEHENFLHILGRSPFFRSYYSSHPIPSQPLF